MRKMLLAAVYTGFAFGANAGSLDGLLNGDMKKLAVHEIAIDLPAATLLDMTDGAHRCKSSKANGSFSTSGPHGARLAVTRCRPLIACNARYPISPWCLWPQAITPRTNHQVLQRGRSRKPDSLARPENGLARAMSVVGLPVTVILNPEGQEVARLIGGCRVGLRRCCCRAQALSQP